MISLHVFCSCTGGESTCSTFPHTMLLPLESIPYANIYPWIKQNDQGTKCGLHRSKPHSVITFFFFSKFLVECEFITLLGEHYKTWSFKTGRENCYKWIMIVMLYSPSWST